MKYSQLLSENIFDCCTFYLMLTKEIKEKNFGIDGFYFDDLLKLVDNSHFYVLIDNNKTPLGFYYMTNMTKNSCMLHYGFMETMSTIALLMHGKYVLSYLLDNYYESIHCIIPVVNNLSIRFSKILGFEFFEKPMKNYFGYSDGLFGIINRKTKEV